MQCDSSVETQSSVLLSEAPGLADEIPRFSLPQCGNLSMGIFICSRTACASLMRGSAHKNTFCGNIPLGCSDSADEGTTPDLRKASWMSARRSRNRIVSRRTRLLSCHASVRSVRPSDDAPALFVTLLDAATSDATADAFAVQDIASTAAESPYPLSACCLTVCVCAARSHIGAVRQL